MSVTAVFSFLVPDFRLGDMVLAKGKAPKAIIERLHGETLVDTIEFIDESLLNESGRYHQSKLLDCPE